MSLVPYTHNCSIEASHWFGYIDLSNLLLESKQAGILQYHLDLTASVGVNVIWSMAMIYLYYDYVAGFECSCCLYKIIMLASLGIGRSDIQSGFDHKHRT